MTVRAKFRVDSITRTMGSKSVKDADGQWRVEPQEHVTVRLVPVYSEDPSSENHAFWEATPAGLIELNTVNATAVAEFQLDQEMFVDFTAA